MPYSKFRGSVSDGYLTTAMVNESSETMLCGGVSSTEQQFDSTADEHIILIFRLQNESYLLDGEMPPSDADIVQVSIALYCTSARGSVLRPKIYVRDAVCLGLDPEYYNEIISGGITLGVKSGTVGWKIWVSTSSNVLAEVKKGLQSNITNFEMKQEWLGPADSAQEQWFASQNHTTVSWRPYLELWWTTKKYPFEYMTGGSKK